MLALNPNRKGILLKYKGYVSHVEYDDEAEIFHDGKSIDKLITDI